jgi:hypothetical protein
MGIEEVVNITITAETQTVSREGFGVPLAAVYHTLNADRVREYSSLNAMVTDGFTAGTAAYRLASKIFGQNPRPKKLKIGRRALPPTVKWRFTPTSFVVGEIYKITFVRPAGTTGTCTYTVQVADTATTVTTALLAAVAAISPTVLMTPTNNTTNFDLTATVAGALTDVQVTNNLTINQTNVDPGIATDLAAILAADQDWYGLCIDSNSKAEVLAAAAWVEANKKLGGFDSYDGDVKAGTASNTFETAQLSAYKRSFGLFGNSSLCFAGAGWLSRLLAFDPGKATTAFKTLAGIEVTTLTDTQKSMIAGDGETHGDGGNHYTRIGGVNITRWGKAFSGQYIDVTRDIDYLEARLKEDVFAKLANLPKVPYTNAGIAIITGTMQARLDKSVEEGILSRDTPPKVYAPALSVIATNSRASRLLPDIEFDGVLQGAIHKVGMTGRLSV